MSYERLKFHTHLQLFRIEGLKTVILNCVHRFLHQKLTLETYSPSFPSKSKLFVMDVRMWRGKKVVIM